MSSDGDEGKKTKHRKQEKALYEPMILLHNRGVWLIELCMGGPPQPKQTLHSPPHIQTTACARLLAPLKSSLGPLRWQAEGHSGGSWGAGNVPFLDTHYGVFIL